MKQTKKSEVKVGLSLLLSIVILILVIAWSKNVDIFSDKKEITIQFASVAGLEIGDMVAVNGVRKGYVDQISISGNSVNVKAILDEDVRLQKDAEFSIMMLDLMGGKKIEITPGISSEVIEFSEVQHGHFSGDVSTAMAQLGAMEANIKTIIEELTVTLNAVNNIIADDNFTKDLKEMSKELNIVTKKVSLLLDENRKGIKELIDSSTQLVSNSNQFIKDNSETISQSLEQTTILLHNSNALIKKIDSFLVETSEQKNNAGILLYDEKFITDLKASLENVKELTSILVDQLKNEGINVDANIDLF